MQTIIVIAVVIIAAAYASWRAYKTLTSKGDACANCPLKDACGKDKSKRKRR